MTIVTHPDEKYYIWNSNKKQRQSAQSFERKVYKINKITSVEGIPTIKIRGQDKKKNKNNPKLFSTQRRIINSKRAH